MARISSIEKFNNEIERANNIERTIYKAFDYLVDNKIPLTFNGMSKEIDTLERHLYKSKDIKNKITLLRSARRHLRRIGLDMYKPHYLYEKNVTSA